MRSIHARFLTIVPAISAAAFAYFVTAGSCSAMGSRSRSSSPRNTCINNLRQIDAAKDMYSLEYGGDTDSTISWAMVSMYVKDITNTMYCPNATALGYDRYFTNNYQINLLGTDPECIVVGARGGHSLMYPSGYTGWNPPLHGAPAGGQRWWAGIADMFRGEQWVVVAAPVVLLAVVWLILGLVWRLKPKHDGPAE